MKKEFKKLTMVKLNEELLENYFIKYNINMQVVKRNNSNLTTIKGYLSKEEYKDLIKVISAIKSGKNYISKNMEKVKF